MSFNSSAESVGSSTWGSSIRSVGSSFCESSARSVGSSSWESSTMSVGSTNGNSSTKFADSPATSSIFPSIWFTCVFRFSNCGVRSLDSSPAKGVARISAITNIALNKFRILIFRIFLL